VSKYEEDKAWADKFLPHQQEIAQQAVRVEFAPIEEDLRRNTDLVLRSVAPPGKRLEDIRISARVRRHKFASRYSDQLTIRLDRPSGVETEMPKLRGGYGDFFIYGFESDLGSDRMHPWLLGNSVMLRDYLNRGGYYTIERNVDNSSRLAAVHLGDMPPRFILASEGLVALDDKRIWEPCRKCWWWKDSGGLAMPLDDNLQPGTGTGRKCLACGFRWQSGWVMSLTAPKV